MFFFNYGINNGDRFEFMIKSFVTNKLGVDDITFEDLYKITNKNIIIIGTNFTKCCEEAFSHSTTPTMSVITAVRISCSVPLYFTPVLYNNCYYVDGGIKNNFPLNYCNKATTLGLYIKHHNSIDDIESVVTILKGCITLVVETITLKDSYYYENIIQIYNDVDDSLNFNLSLENKLKIINLGQISAKKFIDELPTKICSNILNEIINTIEFNSTKIQYHEQSTQTEFDIIEQSTQTEFDIIEQSTQTEFDNIE